MSRNLIFLIFIQISIFSAVSSSCEGKFPLQVKIETKASWGTHKQASIILKNTQQRHICSAKLRMTLMNGTKIFNKWNLKKSDVENEYILPESWILEDFEERRDTGFVLTGMPPKIQPISFRFCDSNSDEIAECRNNSTIGFIVKLEEKQAWGDKKEIIVIFKNLGKKAICYSRFKFDIPVKSKILTSWNMKKLKASGDFVLPTWAKLKPGEEFREAGFLLSGKMPSVKRIKHRYC